MTSVVKSVFIKDPVRHPGARVANLCWLTPSATVVVIFFPLYTVITLEGPTVNHWKMKRVRIQADKDRNAMRKRAARHEDSTKKIDVSEAVRDQVSAARDNLGYHDQKTVISDGVRLLCNYKAEKDTMEKKDEAKDNYIGTKKNSLNFSKAARAANVARQSR